MLFSSRQAQNQVILQINEPDLENLAGFLNFLDKNKEEFYYAKAQTIRNTKAIVKYIDSLMSFVGDYLWYKDQDQYLLKPLEEKVSKRILNKSIDSLFRSKIVLPTEILNYGTDAHTFVAGSQEVSKLDSTLHSYNASNGYHNEFNIVFLDNDNPEKKGATIERSASMGDMAKKLIRIDCGYETKTTLKPTQLESVFV